MNKKLTFFLLINVGVKINLHNKAQKNGGMPLKDTFLEMKSPLKTCLQGKHNLIK